MTPLSLLLAGGFALAAGLAYFLCLATSFRLRWYGYIPMAAAMVAAQQASEYLLGSGYDSELERIAALSLPLLLGTLAAVPCARRPLRTEERTSAADLGWMSPESLLASHARKLQFTFALLPLLFLYLLGQFLAGTWFGAPLGLPTWIIPWPPLVLALAWTRYSVLCPNCRCRLIGAWGKMKGQTEKITFSSMYACPCCGYRQQEKPTEVKPAPPLQDLRISYATAPKDKPWLLHAYWKFSPLARGRLAILILVLGGMIASLPINPNSNWLIAFLILGAVLFLSLRATTTSSHILRDDGIYTDSSGQEIPVCDWSAHIRVFAFKGGLVATYGVRSLFAIPPQALDAEHRAALENFLAAKGIAVEEGDTP